MNINVSKAKEVQELVKCLKGEKLSDKSKKALKALKGKKSKKCDIIGVKYYRRGDVEQIEVKISGS